MHPLPKRHIIISPPLRSAVNKVLRQLKREDFRWVYFGENISGAIAIGKELGGKGQRIEIADKLQEIAWSLRQAYIDYIGGLSLENNSLTWWLSSLSEKSPYNSKAFLHISYIKVFQSLLNSENLGGNFVCFVENSALRSCLAKTLSAFRDYNVSHFELLYCRAFATLMKTFKGIVARCFFTLDSIYRVLLTRYYRLTQAPSEKPGRRGFVILQTWVDHRSFDAKGAYNEVFFGGLVDYLRRRGNNVIVFPYVPVSIQYYGKLSRG